jgi:hypothetical protein
LKKTVLLFLLCVFGFANGFGQSDKEKVGESLVNPYGGSYYNFSDKNKVNIEVNIWGYVRNPGKYLIPKGCTVQDLISYAGGPSLETNLDEIRLFRPKNDSLGISEDKIINLNYDDLMWSEQVNTKKIVNPVLEAGDILVFPGHPKYFFRDNLLLITSFMSVLFVLLNLLVTVKWIK